MLKVNIAKVNNYLETKHPNFCNFLSLGVVSNCGHVVRLAVQEKYVEYRNKGLGVTDSLINIASDFDSTFENILKYHNTSAFLYKNSKKIKPH